jgi:hypothetical protein
MEILAGILIGLGLVGVTCLAVLAVHVDVQEAVVSELRVGDKVKVLDQGLAMLQAVMRRVGEDPDPNNIGWVHEIRGDDILVAFPIGDDDMEEHSQVAPYPRCKVRKLEA